MQKQANPTYLKAITIRDPSDIHTIREDIKKGMILILRVTPLAQKDVEKLRKIVEELYVIARDSGADIARLGEERIVVTPPEIRLQRYDPEVEERLKPKWDRDALYYSLQNLEKIKGERNALRRSKSKTEVYASWEITSSNIPKII